MGPTPVLRPPPVPRAQLKGGALNVGMAIRIRIAWLAWTMVVIGVLPDLLVGAHLHPQAWRLVESAGLEVVNRQISHRVESVRMSVRMLVSRD